jgi:SAM-dependent methyltransferase
MNAWSWLGLALAVLFVVDGLKLRRRLAALPLLRPATPVEGPPLEDTHVLLLAPGVELEATDRMAAIAFAQTHRLDALDLVPGRWGAFRAMAFAQVVDPTVYRTQPLAPGFTAGHALVVSRVLLARTGISEQPPESGLAFLRVAQKLKRYAPRSFDFAIAPGLRAVPQLAVDRFAVARELFLDLTPSVLAGQLLIFSLVIATAALGGWMGWAGLAAFQLQPALALVALPIAAEGLAIAVLLTLPMQLWEWLANLAAAQPDPVRQATIEALRSGYRAELAQGLDRFFEPRRESCYVCGGNHLEVERRLPDLLQHKPGKFTLERCRDCRLLFQNPRLSLAGLAFYYRDFYDGLGESWLETVFGLSIDSYLGRAHELEGKAPRRWLDVGGGYGHFCLIARDVLPETRFDCLDMSESVEEAVRRGWADRGHRGLFPELAPTLAGEYDVVSLSHCLEHTRDPRAEIAAAHVALAKGGFLLIEVPDPESILRKLFRSRWLPYFQPQHQHLLSVGNVKVLLGEAGFEVERVVRGGAHTGYDAFFATFLTLDRWAPPTDLPWRDTSPGGSWWRGFVWGLGMPLLLSAVAFDTGVRSLLSVPRVSNAYRVLARRQER